MIASQPNLFSNPQEKLINLLERKKTLLLKKMALENGTYVPSAGYGEIAKKHTQNLPDVAKQTFGSGLQFLDEMGGYIAPLATASLALKAFDYNRAKEGKQPIGLALRKEAAEDIARNQPYINADEKGKQLASDVTRGVLEMVPALATAPVLGAAPMLFQAGARGGFGSYAEQRDAGRTPIQATIAALPSGLAEVAFETPVAKIFLSKGKPFLKKLIASVVGEGVSEGATAAVQEGIRKGTIRPDMTLKEYLESIGYSAAVGGASGGVIGGSLGALEAIGGRKPATKSSEYAELSDEALAEFEPKPAPQKLLALPAPNPSIPDFENAPIIVGKDGARFQTLPEKQALELEQKRKADLGLNEINLGQLSDKAKKRIREIRETNKPLALPDYSKQVDPEGRIIASPEGSRLETVAEKQKFEAEKQRRIDLGIQDVPRLSEKALQKIRAVRAKQQEVATLQQEKAQAKEIKQKARQEKLRKIEAEKAEKKSIREEVKNQNAQKRDTLFEFIASIGGINPDTKTSKGDVKQVLNKNVYKFGTGNVLSKKGRSLDEVRELAVEAGFLEEKGGDGVAESTVNDLLDAMDSEARGKPVYRRNALIEPTTKDYLANLEEEAFKLGINTEGKTPDKIISEMDAKAPKIDLASMQGNVPEDVAKGLAEEYGIEEDPMLELERMEAPQEADDDGFDVPFFSGFDPNLLSELVGTKEERAEFYAGLKKVPKGVKYLTSNFGGLFGTTFLSIDDALRIRAKIHKMPTIKKIADMLHGGTNDSYSEAVKRRITTNHNKVERILNPIRKDAKLLKRTIYLLQNPKEIVLRRTEADNAAANIAVLLKAERQYMIDAGLEVGEIEGYFPRVFDQVKILSNESAFLNAAKEAYRDTYPEISEEDIDAKAEAWVANVKLSNAGISTIGNDFTGRSGSSKPSALKERVLSKKADEILKEFLLQDPQEVLTVHFISTAKKAEFERRFNISAWKALKEQMVKEADARPDIESQMKAHNAIRETISDIRYATGNNVSNISQGSKNVLAWAKMFGAMGMLPYATLSSLPEVVAPALRAGSVKESFAGLAYAWRRLIKDKSVEEQRLIAQEIIGVSAQAVSDMAAEQRMGGELGTATTRKLMAKYFSAIGLHQFTEGMRVASTGVGMRYIATLSREMAKKPKKTQMYLRDLGIAPEDAKGFSEWVLKNGSGKVSAKILQGDGDYENMYKRALTRFVDQSIIAPVNAEKPRFASHEVGSVFYYLQSFLYGFQKNVILRQAKNAKRAVTESGLSVTDRAALAAPLILTPIIIGALQYGLGDLRDKLLNSETKEKMSPERQIARALSRTGYYGQLDPWVNLFAGLKYRKDPATVLAGPVFGGLFDTFAAFANLSMNNSDKTNTQERQATKQFWRVIAKPMMVGIFSAIPGPMKVPLIQAVSHPQTEEEFIKSIAGKKKK